MPPRLSADPPVPWPGAALDHALGKERRIHLPAGHATRLALNAATRLHCTVGTLWLTVDGRRDDYVLTAGQALLLRDLRPLHVVVAMEDAEMALTAVSGLSVNREVWWRRGPAG